MPLRLTPALPPRVRRRALPARVTAMVSPTSKSTGLGDGHGFADLAPPVDPANAHPGSPDQVVNGFTANWITRYGALSARGVVFH